MTNIKKGFYGVATAMAILTMTLMSMVSQVGIQSLIKEATGWKPPKWVAVTIAALGTAVSIVAVVAAFGVTMPNWLAVTCAGLGSISK